MYGKIFCLLAFFVLLAGCSKKTQPEAASRQADFQTAPQSITTAGSPTDVLVEVDGIKLTRKEADEEVENRIAMIGNQIPPEQLAQNLPRIKQGLMENVIRQFVDRTLILNEAERLKIEVNDADISNAYKKIEATLPEGLTLEEAMAQSPLGKEEIKKEIDLSIKINKFFETALSNKFNITENEINDFMENNKDKITIPETVEARHILIQFSQDDDEKSKVEKKNKINEIREKIVKGADFAEMARQYSDCPSSQNGGNLGKFPRGQMVQAFEEAAFSQKINEVGDVIETPFGYHIIQVLNHEKEGPMPKEQIIEMVRNQQMQKGALELIRDLRSKAKITYADNIFGMPSN